MPDPLEEDPITAPEEEPDPARSRIKVLYVLGRGRTGSTLFGNLLAQTPGICHVGEFTSLWNIGLREGGRMCGCGSFVIECPFWREVAATVFGPDWGEEDIDRMEGLRREAVRIRNVPMRLMESESARAKAAAGSDATGHYARSISTVYRAIASVAGSNTVVDSSKASSAAAFLRVVPDIDAYFVNLVRDPRAVAYSLQRVKSLPDGSLDPRAGALTSTTSPSRAATQWLARQAIAELHEARTPRSRRMTVRYEDLAGDPNTVVRSVRQMLGEPPADLPFVDGQAIDMAPTHTVGGNPSRVASGPTVVKPDVEWRTKLPEADTRVVTAITAPLLPRYRYPIRNRNRNRRD